MQVWRGLREGELGSGIKYDDSEPSAQFGIEMVFGDW